MGVAMSASFFSLDAILGLATLTLMEIVLGIDNVVFIAVLVGKLPAAQQALARQLGLALALGIRILLLLSIYWIMGLTRPLWTLGDTELSGRSLILLGGGLFLMFKATREIYEKVEGEHHEGESRAGQARFGWVLLQILLLDIVFSLDSVITAVGMTDRIGVMVAAVVGAVAIMMFFAGSVSAFVERHPTVKMLALSFLLLIGVTLIAEGLHFHIPKGYVYFAMAFSLGVEMLNLRLRRAAKEPVKLHARYSEEEQAAAGGSGPAR
jgi:predicted tellurium resistance membrane protein TerC